MLVLLAAAAPAAALDVFTLWRQPEVPLRLEEGAWVDYRTQVMTGGRRRHGLTRLACLGRDGQDENASWILEILPLAERDDGSLVPVKEDAVRLEVAPALAERAGSLLDNVRRARQWRGGKPTDLSLEQLRENPLLAASLEDEFVADSVETKHPTTRVVGGHELLCDQLVLTAEDTDTSDLPAGRVIQTTVREISAAVHADVPFLGLVYVAERVRSSSRLDPPSDRFRDPPPQSRVEIMELVGFGDDAKPVLTGSD
ncbi:MAG: hypothetical protein GY838_11850 [bacterium]|nr:hypothetical protein [bacterium]